MLRLCALAGLLLLAPVGSARAEEHSAASSGGEVVPAAAPPLKAGEKRMYFKAAHAFSRDEARARTGYLFEYWKRRYGVASRWDGDRAVVSGTIMGVSFTAWLEITDTLVMGECTDPGFFTRRMAWNYIDKKLKKYLHPTYDDP